MSILTFRKAYRKVNYRMGFYPGQKTALGRMHKKHVQPSTNRQLYKPKVKINIPNNSRKVLLSLYVLMIPQGISIIAEVSYFHCSPP